jgi:hypothetical protein
MSIVLPPTIVEDTAASASVRPVARKLGLRVSGARPGSVVRPADPGQAAVGARTAPRLGLRVHTSTLAPRPASVTPPIDPSDYASLDDYEDLR